MLECIEQTPDAENIMAKILSELSRSTFAPRLPGPTPTTQKCRPKFSMELEVLAQQFAGHPACLSDLLTATKGRGFDFLLLLIGLPFLTPIPLPGISTLFGFVVLLIGARLALGRRPWLPKKLLRRELPARFIARVLTGASRAVRWLEILLRPRLDFLHEQWIYRRVAGVLIMLSGALLLLPLPIPLTNTLPALTVVLLAAGAMERDGLFFLAGCATFAVTLAYFGLLIFGGVHLLDHLRRTLLGA
jgi:hypothetical protein